MNRFASRTAFLVAYLLPARLARMTVLRVAASVLNDDEDLKAVSVADLLHRWDTAR